jgi:hypothetical protein
MHSPRGHFSEKGLGVFQLGVTPIAFLYEETLRNRGYFFHLFVIHS